MRTRDMRSGASDVALPLRIPEVARAIEGAHVRRHAVGQRLFQFLIDLDDVDLREAHSSAAVRQQRPRCHPCCR
jgi:hypothetical protein